MAELHKMIATIKGALKKGAAPLPRHAGRPELVPISPSAARAELASRFASELEAVGGRFLGIIAPSDLSERVAACARELGARRAATGRGVLCDEDALAAGLRAAGCDVFRTSASADGVDARARIARADLGVVEAQCAIAATGTMAVVADPARPASLTLLPPACLVVVHVSRLVADLAAALDALGADVSAGRRITLITGPSRTADIEKRIVLGVHGPSTFAAAIVWTSDD